jgi:hypothetical protein
MLPLLTAEFVILGKPLRYKSEYVPGYTVRTCLSFCVYTNGQDKIQHKLVDEAHLPTHLFYVSLRRRQTIQLRRASLDYSVSVYTPFA